MVFVEYLEYVCHCYVALGLKKKKCEFQKRCGLSGQD